jgi:kynurenine formamidase
VRRIAAVALLPLAAACGARADSADVWIDLSHPLSAETLYWPTGTPFELEVLSRGADSAGRWYAANRFRTPEHLGTHLDAPIHFDPKGWTAEQIPVERMSGPAFVVDARALADADRDLAIPVSALEGFEKTHGGISRGAVVLLRTGWDARWPDRARYFGSTKAGDASDLHFPGLSADAARWLVRRGVHAVGIDTASIDPGPSRTFEAHRALGGANVLVYENLRALDRLPARGAVFYAFPLAIRDGTGGPVRAAASIPGR